MWYKQSCAKTGPDKTSKMPEKVIFLLETTLIVICTNGTKCVYVGECGGGGAGGSVGLL